MSVAIGTRLHLGSASSPPSTDSLRDTLNKFDSFSKAVEGVHHVYIAVDSTPKFEGFDLVETVRKLLEEDDAGTANTRREKIRLVLPVTPWNKFTPALNAIVTQAALDGNKYCLMASAETSASNASIQQLLRQMSSNDDDTLVVGAVLPGHDYVPNTTQSLNGRTTPWNTLSLWHVNKLALTGFPLVAEGLHHGVAAGVEEVTTIAILQRILGSENAIAKLIPLPDVEWQQEFADEGRRKWHEAKMNSKLERAKGQLALLSTEEGFVHHI